jgi:hypothetical protein
MVYLLLFCAVPFGLSADLNFTLDTQEDQLLSGPRAAFNTIDGLFLAVWEYHYGNTDWDIDGHILDATGQPVGGPFGIAWSGSIMQQEADVAYNPVTNQFLVVYSLSPDNWKISACIVAGDGTPGSFVPIADSVYREFNPAVACDPVTAEYLVVYERELSLDNVVWREVWAQRVNSDGIRISDPYRLSMPGTHSLDCAVACAGGQYLAVWTEQSTSGKGQILGRIIQCGYPSKTTFTLAAARDSMRPQVVYNAARAEYMVVYQTRTSSSAYWTLEGTRVNTLGDLKGTQMIAEPEEEHCKAPAVAYRCADGQYIVTWAQAPLDAGATIVSHQIWAQCINDSGEPVDNPIPISDPGKNLPVGFGVPAPAVATGTCGTSLILWEDQGIGLNPEGPSVTLCSIKGASGTWGNWCGNGDSEVESE